jgi:hypothetical protein
MLKESKVTKESLNFQDNYVTVGTKDEGNLLETVTKEIKDKGLAHQKNYMEDEEQHSSAMLTNLDGELKLLEEWLINPKIEEYCTKATDIV